MDAAIVVALDEAAGAADVTVEGAAALDALEAALSDDLAGCVAAAGGVDCGALD